MSATSVVARPTPRTSTASIIGRPLSLLRNTTLKVPLPGGHSFRVSQRTRNPPVSLVKVSVWTVPRPDHAPTVFQTSTSVGGGVLDRHAETIVSAHTTSITFRRGITDRLPRRQRPGIPQRRYRAAAR